MAPLDIKLIPVYNAGTDIVVSAAKRPQKITDAPASIQLISQKDLQEFAGSNVGELAAYVPGVEFVRMGIDNVSFNARGLNNAFNNKVFQMVDGRNSSNPLSGNLMLGNNMSTNKEDLEKIEILLGPQTALHGPNVHNALFNYITKDPRKYEGTTLSLTAGNHYQYSGRVRHAYKVDSKWAYKLTGEFATGRDFEFYDSVYAGGGPNGVFGPIVGVPERNIDFDFRHIRGEGHVYYGVSSKSDIIISAGGSNNNTINTHTGGHNQFAGMTNHFVQGRYTSPRFYFTFYNTWADFGKSFNVSGRTRDYWNRTHSTATSGPNARLLPEDAEVFASRPGNAIRESSQRLNAEAQHNFFFENAGLQLVTGLSLQKDKPNGYGINLVDSFKKISVSQYGAVLQLEKSLPFKTRFIGAARLDNHSNFGSFISPKLGMVKRIGNSNVRVTWGKAHSMPSILYQYASTFGQFFGNGEGIKYIPVDKKFSDPTSVTTTKPLLPEEVSTFELGYKGKLAKKMFVDVSYFNGTSKNFFSPSVAVRGRVLSVGDQVVSHNPAFAGIIVNDTLKNANFVTVFNFGKVNVNGIDLSAHFDVSKFFSLSLNYSRLASDIIKGKKENDANRDGFVLADERSLNAPEHRGMIKLKIRNAMKQKMFANVTARFVEEYNFFSGNQIATKEGKDKRGIIEGPSGMPKYLKNYNRGALGGFCSIDMQAGYKLNNATAVNVSITNLLNTEQRQFAGSPSIGRLINFELRMHFTKLVK